MPSEKTAGSPAPTIETSLIEAREETLRRQLNAFAQFSSRSLGQADIDALMLDACIRARAGLGVTHAKLLEYLPDRDRLILRSGVGWKDGYIGKYLVAPDIESPIGRAFLLSQPVPVSDYTKQVSYPYPAILREHGCVSSVNVPLRTDEGTFGVLEVDHVDPRAFGVDDITFLTGLGNTLARAVELRRALIAMQVALDGKQLLLREMNHRIKNNLSLVSAILSLQARRSDSTTSAELSRAVSRINNFALVHDRLQMFTTSVSQVDAAPHFEELAEMLRSMLPPGVVLNAQASGSINGDAVESLTLMANELVTNAAKHAFAGREKGEIILGYRQEGAGWRLWVYDDGVGAHSVSTAHSFGHQLLSTLASRLSADISVTTGDGTRINVVCGIHS